MRLDCARRDEDAGKGTAMEGPPIWEKILIGAIMVAVVLFFRPGIRAALERSRRAEDRDWGAALVPVGIIVLFVVLTILWVRSHH
jgi:hypothetical protein